MTLRLAGFALQNWAELDGYAVSQNMPPLTDLPLDRFSNFIIWYCLRNADEKERAKFDQQLYRPPPGKTATKGPWTAEAETAAFAAAKAALTAK